MSETILIHVESDSRDKIVEVKSPDDPKLGVFVSDGPYVTYDGEKVLEAYTRGTDGVWVESVTALNDLYSAVMEQGVKDVQRN